MGYRLRGEFCIGFASSLSLVSLILLIFLHVGQISTSTVPRSISMAKVNTSNYGAALAAEFNDPIHGLYTTNTSLPLSNGTGLRTHYSWGLYSYCAFSPNTTSTTNSTSSSNLTTTSSSSDGEKKLHGKCSNSTVARKFQPYRALTADMIANYTQFTDNIFAQASTRFDDSNYLGSLTTPAYYLILLGTICSALAFFVGILRHTYTFFLSTLFALVGSLLLLVAAAIWTAALASARSVNALHLTRPDAAPAIALGIHLDAGNGLFILWAAFATLFASLGPYLVSCCTFRG
ncbi:hypothetical protein PUNSTDRAFT_94437 [Punctularia strigosozonata HHB-11173 SS5]|uniref:uncharacterized protein n=1 Tax=Punctularia strigosozonata (strain HHB-11173) TaxID=741275 RepID=UPI0004416396|nr:uncharacterized protein PUNSTDRAFT_94437 [Punctularia strigosozonata HHB-11173 SS5]EIN13394.1 hypothetical protein PUNSTDRAFT_94437 [Punctularia strigosozonata HHB-11173 SS5]